MATDVVEAVDCPAVRLWLGFEPNAMMLPPVHAGDAVGYDFHAVWERDHYAHYDSWVQKRVPWIAKLEKAQRLEIKRRRNELTAGDAPSRRTSATPGATQSMLFSASYRGLVVGGGGAENAAADTAADGKEGSGSGSGSESGSERRRSIAMLVHLKKNLARLRQVRRALLLDPVPVPALFPSLSHTSRSHTVATTDGDGGGRRRYRRPESGRDDRVDRPVRRHHARGVAQALPAGRRREQQRRRPVGPHHDASKERGGQEPGADGRGGRGRPVHGD